MSDRNPTFDELLYEKPADQVVRITLNPPEARNAQGLPEKIRASLTAAAANQNA